MDVLSPELIWIGTRCYRINQPLDGTVERPTFNPPPTQYIEEDLYQPDETEEDDQYVIDCKNGRYSTSFHVPSQFFAQIIGAKGATRRRIESETKSQIAVPKQGHEGDIKITSNSRKNVVAARRRIEIIVIGGRSNINFTHFVSVPMVNPEIRETFKAFKEMIMTDTEIFGLNEAYFQNPNKLHMTIATLTLLDNVDRAQAGQFLIDCEEQIVKKIINDYGPLEVEMRGLEIMNDDPSATSVLYAQVDCEPLQVIADKIYEYFVAQGVMQKKYDRVKLHVTLINSLFGSESDPGDGKGERETFDASRIMEKYREYNFGKVVVKEIHLSQRYTTGSNGYYEATSLIKV